ncbi:MAG: hypothetical protein EOP52_13950 [Sphingobacteriales bacterium]|nr:MAG: hypothetical protein EOP52_13950 [Sphingobacteriales bacterium]
MCSTIAVDHGRSVALGGSVIVMQEPDRLEVIRGEGQDEAFPIAVAMLVGPDEVGVRLSCKVEGEGELVAQLRWYPGGWSSESGPVGEDYELLNEAMIPDGGPISVEAGNEDHPLPVQMRSNGGLALVLRSVNSGSGKLVAAEVAYETVIRAVQTYVVLSCDTDGVWGGGYQYGFNGQRKTDEISGAGNHNTAMFWEYDTRLGLRWNNDPVRNPSESPYTVNHSNPIQFNDPDGDQSPATTSQPSTPVIRTITEIALKWFGGPVGRAIVAMDQIAPTRAQLQQQAAARAEHERLTAKETNWETFKRVWAIEKTEEKKKDELPSRNEALKKAKDHAQVPRNGRGGEDIPMGGDKGVNETSRGKNWEQQKADGATRSGRRGIDKNGDATGNSWQEHLDGHPDAGQKGVPEHHGSGHFHSTNRAGESRVIPYRK